MKTKITRSDWLNSEWAYHTTQLAREWRHAYVMAQVNRCPKNYLLFCRQQMRVHALGAVAAVRNYADRRAAVAA